MDLVYNFGFHETTTTYDNIIRYWNIDLTWTFSSIWRGQYNRIAVVNSHTHSAEMLVGVAYVSLYVNNYSVRHNSAVLHNNISYCTLQYDNSNYVWSCNEVAAECQHQVVPLHHLIREKANNFAESVTYARIPNLLTKGTTWHGCVIITPISTVIPSDSLETILYRQWIGKILMKL